MPSSGKFLHGALVPVSAYQCATFYFLAQHSICVKNCVICYSRAVPTGAVLSQASTNETADVTTASPTWSQRTDDADRLYAVASRTLPATTTTLC